MDKPSEILKSLEERVTNPLLASFLFSFFACNWKIPVAILLYSPEELFRRGYIDHFHLIRSSVVLLWPIIISIVYTLLYPIIKYYLISWAKLMKASAESWYIKRSGEKSILLSKYIDLDKKHQENTIQYEQFLQREDELMEEIEKLKVDKEQLKRDLAHQSQFNDLAIRFNETKNFEGRWSIINMLDSLEEGISGKRTYDISNTGQIFWISDIDSSSRTFVGTIETIAANPITKKILVNLTYNKDSKNRIHTALLQRDANGGNYQGNYQLGNQSKIIMERKA